MSRKEPSQHEIAKCAGVARTTVSLVMRGGVGLKQETIDKVHQAAEKLGYRPNLMATTTRTGKSRMVGVMVPPIDSHWSQISCGIHDALSEKKYIPLFLWQSHVGDENMHESRELEQVHLMLDCRIGAVILWPYFAKMFEKHIQEFSSRNLPVVTVDCRVEPGIQADAVLGDDPAGARAVARHFRELGHTKIIHFCGPESETWSQMRRQVFAEEIDCLSVEVELTSRRLPHLRKVLSENPETTAVFASSDKIARDVYRVAAEMNLRIPEDLSIVGYSDLDFAEYLTPSLTTVHDHPYQMGRRAAEMALERMTGTERGSSRIEQLPVELMVRQSTRAV